MSHQDQCEATVHVSPGSRERKEGEAFHITAPALTKLIDSCCTHEVKLKEMIKPNHRGRIDRYEV